MTPPSASTPAIQNVAGKRRFAVSITIFTILGHVWLGFEASYAQPIVAVLTGYAVQLLLEFVDAHAYGHSPRYQGGPVAFIDFLTSAHIAALSIAMLLYFNDRLLIVAFVVATAISSKYILRIRLHGRWVHFMNPSNLAISLTLLLFPWVGLAMPWQFSVSLTGYGDWLLPLTIICLGSILNFCFTQRLSSVVSFLVAFVAQAMLRSLTFGTPLLAALMPATGVEAFIFAFYMLPDPATSPSRVRSQIVFGSSVGLMYGVLVVCHIVFGLFFALTIVCAVRGLWMSLLAFRKSSATNDVRPESDPLFATESASIA